MCYFFQMTQENLQPKPEPEIQNRKKSKSNSMIHIRNVHRILEPVQKFTSIKPNGESKYECNQNIAPFFQVLC